MTTKEIYVSNLDHELTNADLQKIFEEFGTVVSANIIVDRDTGRSKGFGFVKMQTEEETQKAIESLNGKEVSGRNLVVNEARPRPPRGDRNNFGRRGGGGNRSFGPKRRF